MFGLQVSFLAVFTVLRPFIPEINIYFMLISQVVRYLKIVFSSECLDLLSVKARESRHLMITSGLFRIMPSFSIMSNCLSYTLSNLR